MNSEFTSSAEKFADPSFLPAPAVSRPGAMPRSAGAVPAMLAPFVATEAWTRVTAGPAEEASPAFDAAEDGVATAAPAQLPTDESASTWFAFESDASDDRVDLAAAVAGADASPEPAAAETSEDLPSWMAWIEDEETDAPGVDVPLVEIDDLLADPVYEVEELPRDPILQLVEQVVEDSDEAALAGRVAEATSKLSATEAGGMPAGFAGAFHEVADRLENIAGSLRRRSAGDAGAATGATDPLELLLTGFVLGYVARQGTEPTPPGKER
jgi:hypothetical protein